MTIQGQTDDLRKYGVLDMAKPHIRKWGAHWFTFKDRTSRVPISCTSTLARLKEKQPFKTVFEATVWYGDAKPS